MSVITHNLKIINGVFIAVTFGVFLYTVLTCHCYNNSSGIRKKKTSTSNIIDLWRLVRGMNYTNLLNKKYYLIAN